jgi:hypothetical protein
MNIKTIIMEVIIMTEFETFYDTVKDYNGKLMLTIDSKVAQFMGLEKGDEVKVMIQKKKVEQSD